MKRLMLSVCSLILLVLAMPVAKAQTTQLTFAHVGGPGSLYQVAADEFARRANEELPSDFRVVVSGQSRHGNDLEILHKIKNGEVAFGLPSSVMSSASPEFGIFELPFLIRNHEHAQKLSDALLEPVLQPAAKARGYRILAMWENGFRQITNNVRPIKTPADLAGINLRVPKGHWRIKAFKKLGANPVPMGLGDTYEALQKKTIDGQENPLAQIHGSKFDEVQRYLTLSDHIYSPAYLIVSEEHFSSLPPEVQQVLNNTAVEMRNWIHTKAIRMEAKLLDGLSKSMQTNHIDVDLFRAATRSIYIEFASSIPDGFDLMLKVSDLAGAQKPVASD